jgi:hypothetical protein
MTNTIQKYEKIISFTICIVTRLPTVSAYGSLTNIQEETSNIVTPMNCLY